MTIQNFLDMTIDDLLELQQELKYINDFTGPLYKPDDIENFQENINFFRDIAAEIDYKYDELWEDDGS